MSQAPFARPDDTGRLPDALRRACELAQVALRPPLGCEITANLLLPMKDGERLAGLKVTAQDDYRPGREHPVIPLDAPGASFT